MNVSRTAIVSVLPSAIVAARFVVPGNWTNGYTWFFGVTGFLATLIGCLVAAVLLRRRAARMPLWVVTTIAVVVAAILLTIFPFMPSWPFTGEGFIVAWVAMAGVFTVALLAGVSLKYV